MMETKKTLRTHYQIEYKLKKEKEKLPPSGSFFSYLIALHCYLSKHNHPRTIMQETNLIQRGAPIPNASGIRNSRVCVCCVSVPLLLKHSSFLSLKVPKIPPPPPRGTIC